MNRFTTCHFLLALVFFVPVSDGFAQSGREIAPDTIRVGDLRVDGSMIRPLKVRWSSVSISEGGESTPAGFTEERVEFVDVEGDRLLKFSQAWYNPKDELLYVNTQVANPHTLAQRRFHSLSPAGSMGHIDIEGTSLSGAAAYRPEAEGIRFDFELEEPVFADGLAGLFYASFPLKKGLSVVAPGFGWGGSCSAPCLSWTSFTVVGQEQMLVAGLSSKSAWVIEVPGTNDSTVTYWLIKEAPYLLKAVAQNNKGGQRVFEIESWQWIE